MAVTFPISADDFFKALPVTDMTFTLTDQRASASTRRGELIISDSGDQLWEGTVTLDIQDSIELERVYAFAELLKLPEASFMAAPIHVSRSFPGSTPKLSAVRNGNEIKINGLALGTVIEPGSFLSFQYGSNPVRHGLHQVVAFDDETIGVSGETTYLRVVPNVAPGYTLNNAVKLANPECKAIMEPNSLAPVSFTGEKGNAWSFRWRQTKR